MYSQGTVETSCYKCFDDIAPYYCISIVECTVHRVIGSAVKPLMVELEIFRGSQSLDVVFVTILNKLFK